MNKLGNAIFMFFFGLIFVAIGLGVAIFLATDCEFNCSRISNDQGSCQYIEKKLLSKKVRDFQLSNVKETQVKENCDSDGCTYSARLYLHDGNSISITGGGSSSGSGDKYDYTNDINTFIKDPNQKTLNAEYKGALFLYIFGGIFALLGAAVSIGGVFSFLRGMFL